MYYLQPDVEDSDGDNGKIYFLDKSGDQILFQWIKYISLD